MRRTDPAGAGGAPASPPRLFILYVEGPRDREILRRWAHCVAPTLGRAVASAAVILGGRQPARAVEHFRRERGAQDARAICVLDRDAVRPQGDRLPEEPGIEFYTWRRRHIESYLLVPEAIRRVVGLPREAPRVERLIREHLPAHTDEEVLREFDAKRLLHSNGPLARALGRELPAGRIARAMQKSEIHPDVLELLGRVRSRVGLTEVETRFVDRSR